MDPILVFFNGKIAQQSDAINWSNQLETKNVKAPLY